MEIKTPNPQRKFSGMDCNCVNQQGKSTFESRHQPRSYQFFLQQTKNNKQLTSFLIEPECNL